MELDSETATAAQEQADSIAEMGSNTDAGLPLNDCYSATYEFSSNDPNENYDPSEAI